MTVCVATIFDNKSIIGASDRMLTSGVIEFQPNQSKVWQLTTSIAVMVAGDIGIQSEMFQKVAPVVYDRIKAEPNNWWKVEDVAELYSKYHSELRSKRAEQEILLPLGLDQNTFIKRQQEMSPEWIKSISPKLLGFQLPETEVICAGIDSTGPHLYLIENGKISCNDQVGFGSIGIGRWHSNSHLMVSGHTRSSPGSTALLITHQAKKKAEVAPGVGTKTDMFMIGPQLGSIMEIQREWIDTLDKIYKEYLSKILALDRKTHKKLNDYIKSKVSETPATPQQTASDDKKV